MSALAMIAPRRSGAPDVWAEPVRGDRMSPTLRHGQDYVLVRATDRYEGEGVYLIRDGVGEPSLVRIASAFNGKRQLRLYGDNQFYDERLIDAGWFEDHVLGVVIADIVTRRTSEMRRLTERAA